MPEPSLSLTFADLKSEVGFFLGYGRGSGHGGSAWTDLQTRDIESAVKAGLRQFYSPPPLEGRAPHEWSFLKPQATVTLLSGNSSVRMPPDFAGLDGRLDIAGTTGRMYTQVPVVTVGQVSEQYALTPDRTGFPLIAAIRPVTPQATGQRHDLYVFPLADSDYTLRFVYYVSPNYLTDAFPYHMGGMMHAETVRESCLACAEETIDDTRAVHSQKFRERLAASIVVDRKVKAQELGYNRDLSDEVGIGARGRIWNGGTVSFYGVTPG